MLQTWGQVVRQQHSTSATVSGWKISHSSFLPLIHKKLGLLHLPDHRPCSHSISISFQPLQHYLIQQYVAMACSNGPGVP